VSETLLIEIGTEELPPKALLRLMKAFANAVETALKQAEFAFVGVTPFATPRRLALSISALAGEQADRVEQRRGPALTAAFDEAGQPTKAALGFARSCGVDVAELGRIKTAQGEWLNFERELKGRTIAEVVPDIINAALAALPIPKRMRWGAGDIEFVRPVHWLVVLYGNSVIDCEILGQRSACQTYGHRFHHPEPMTLVHADDYAERLASEGFVVASFAARQQNILEQLASFNASISGQAVVEQGLLDEVTALVEWPVLIDGSFDAHFLRLPQEVLIASMQDHQKYFPVQALDGSLQNRFITVSNIASREPQIVRGGNERVIRPRLADADFFYRTDSGVTLASRLDALHDMLFEKRLGSLLDKTRRVQAIAENIAVACRTNRQDASRAALLSRCDLLSAMVGEFPELQGVMGKYYAAADGESEAISAAIGEFYWPRFAGDLIPASATGRCIAIADRLDSLVGIFGIGSAPTGDKDPYALRRAALGTLRILIEGDIDLDLDEVISLAFAGYADIALGADTTTLVYNFMRERLRGYYQERGVSADVCAAVLANNPTSPTEISRRIQAVIDFTSLPESAALAAANKRIANILKKLDTAVPTTWSISLLRDPAECALAAQLDDMREDIERSFDARDYRAYLQRLAGLRQGIDDFFEQVMVMSEDLALRNNRLAMLAHLHGLFTRIADVAQLPSS
jgi:glycyl-tRNA synthetase beta chain